EACFDIAPQCDGEFTRHGHDGAASETTSQTFRSLLEPLYKFAWWLVAAAQPSQFNHCGSPSWVARFRDAQIPIQATAPEGAGGQPEVTSQAAPIGELTIEDLGPQDGCDLRPDALQMSEALDAN